jgi:tetratricopeptide (TPR) repeat protein
MKHLLAIVLLLTAVSASAQITPGKLSFALPDHSGSLSLDQGQFKITELSAKPNNREFGVRAEDGDLQLLGFLFLWPEKPHLTSETCRDEMLESEGEASLAAVKGKLAMKSASGADVALALMIPKSGDSSSVRAFVANGDLCADLAFSVHQPITQKMVPMQQVKDILATLRFDPQAKPTFRDAFAYATVEWDKQQIKGAAVAYKSALALVDTSDDPLKWRRVTTDQFSMALGMSGDIQQSRAVNEAAIQRDPDYPIYYYDLACADAEQGNASGARAHLQQAFARKSHTLPGETMPDPAQDDSILKLKSDVEFWKFVQTLH